MKKAVIPAAGPGTRMLPVTSVVPKELLPICGKPVIHHVVQEAVDAGIEEVILILRGGNEAIADYFTPNKQLADRLLRTGNTKELQELEHIWDMAKITVIFQEEPKGLGHAVLCASEAIENEPFAVLLGDSIIRTDDRHSYTQQLLSAFLQYNRSIVGVQQVEDCAVSRYAILEGAEFGNGVHHAQKLMEKPTREQTASNLAFCARYVFKPEIFSFLQKTGSGPDHEVRLTDAMQQMMTLNGLIGIELTGERFDISDPKGLLLANLSMTEFGCG